MTRRYVAATAMIAPTTSSAPKVPRESLLFFSRRTRFRRTRRSPFSLDGGSGEIRWEGRDSRSREARDEDERSRLGGASASVTTHLPSNPATLGGLRPPRPRQCVLGLSSRERRLP